VCEFAQREAAKVSLDAALAAAGGDMDRVGLLECPLGLRCRGKQRGTPPSMCPHDLRCVVCDMWSCYRCGIVHADGEQTQLVVEEDRPDMLFLDFDRTLATTRTGGNPLDPKLSVKPTVEPSLRQAALSFPAGRVHVVTRNSHSYEIKAFLEQHGLSHVEVHSVKQVGATTKADVMRRLLPDGHFAYFCDDSVAEVVDPNLRQLTRERRLVTIFFSRTKVHL